MTPDGQLDPAALLDAVLDFWRQHVEPHMQSAPYHEAAPHLVLLPFLDRVAEGASSASTPLEQAGWIFC